ncbi:hypothetical protein J2S66_002898 [Saccharothrix longispora]|uniref:DDE Tnp4 domain-containing protein n=1 Tax=Saccharothrix longispora TaxID=33920 RepID=A0ABU1PV65_9PSEU|nr:hypothetical protein [Saccharothrix longispora]
MTWQVTARAEQWERGGRGSRQDSSRPGSDAPTGRLAVLSCPAAIPLSDHTLVRLGDLIRAERVRRRSRWRRLDPGRQALPVLAHLRNGDSHARLAAGGHAARLAYAILDGTLVPIDRATDQKPYCSGKHHRHGVNVQVPADPAGRLVWVSAALPGAVHDLTAARTHGLVDMPTAHEVTTFADKTYRGAGGTVRTPFKRHATRPRLSRGQKAVNRAHARIRALGERAVSLLPTPGHRDRRGHPRPAPHRDPPPTTVKAPQWCGEVVSGVVVAVGASVVARRAATPPGRGSAPVGRPRGAGVDPVRAADRVRLVGVAGSVRGQRSDRAPPVHRVGGRGRVRPTAPDTAGPARLGRAIDRSRASVDSWTR